MLTLTFLTSVRSHFLIHTIWLNTLTLVLMDKFKVKTSRTDHYPETFSKDRDHSNFLIHVQMTHVGLPSVNQTFKATAKDNKASSLAIKLTRCSVPSITACYAVICATLNKPWRRSDFQIS
ncbi:hypothetical protein PoB_000119800 [Plakobranchus ocellatus]|uniref:Uncharacterized protein n=1 Tax=Plakobranchus ocellatus TaxID=259542 RepID=A0AAV3XXH1_9GAST|nr:hypothetical protein PoB_000119800 [Plakobranchus ocellatus]